MMITEVLKNGVVGLNDSDTRKLFDAVRNRYGH